jgi:DNA-binding transcriptional regulator/RsmH inhibitor MraZ
MAAQSMQEFGYENFSEVTTLKTNNTIRWFLRQIEETQCDNAKRIQVVQNHIQYHAFFTEVLTSP